MIRGLVLALALLLAVIGTAGPAHAGVAAPGQQPDAPAVTGSDDGGSTGDGSVDTNPQPGAPDQNIIPRPNSGHPPTDAGDRGGALQIFVFVAIVAGVGAIVALAIRDSRRSRSRVDQR